MSGSIKAITFDLWDTMIQDNSDESERKTRGLGTKADDRRRLMHEALRRHGDIAYDTVATARPRPSSSPMTPCAGYSAAIISRMTVSVSRSARVAGLRSAW